MGKEAADTGLLVCAVAQPRPMPNGTRAMPWHEFPAWLEGELRSGC
jgi:hypothetical protein